ncbi:MAG: aldehyde ferredoxin oxidoreductase [Methanobacteriota archaeon]|nr:MAG: aldehyde ferredoxin oxidoreductase [Euryarchaeota archaeon]
MRFACIVNELRHFVGRCGLGAVMGSKNLKAVAVRGTGKVGVADPEGLKGLNRWFMDSYRENPDVSGLSRYGTAQYINSQNETCQLPTRNFTTGFFEGAGRLSAEAIKEEVFAYDYGCYVCPVKCKKAVKGGDLDPDYGGPEYEGLGALGSLCGVSDLKAVAKANEICNSAGMDVISAGVTVAFAMECFEKGLLGREDTGGLDLRFGNGEALVKALEMTADAEGVGRLLSQGVARAAEEIGGRAKELAMHVKGLETPLHDPRRKGSLALAYSLSPTGADHLQGEHDHPFSKKGLYLERLAPLGINKPLVPESLDQEKVRFFVLTQRWNSAGNCIGICNFARGPIRVLDLDKVAGYLKAVTGWDTSLEDLLTVGERAITMARLFNIREGFTASDDTLPERFFHHYEACGRVYGGVNREAFADALKRYYRLMGWDEEGVPEKKRLHELGIDEMATGECTSA